MSRGDAVRKYLLLLAACLAAVLPSRASAKDYPARTIKMIVSNAAGSVTDVILRRGPAGDRASAAGGGPQQPRPADRDREHGRRFRDHGRPRLRAGEPGRLHDL